MTDPRSTKAVHLAHAIAAADGLPSLLDVAEAIVKERLARLGVTVKGDLPGHPFRGNQWTEGTGGGGESGGDSVQRMGIAESVARDAGVDPSSVEYGGDGYAFSVGDDNFIAVGQFDPATGKITLYRGALVNDEVTKAVTAHESQHAKYQAVMDEYHVEVQKILKDPRDTITPSGKVRDEFKGEFQTYSAIQPYFEERAKELIKKDGITPYSRSYWKAHAEGKVHFQTAVNETLAEVSSQKALGVKVGIPTIWRQMHNDVDLQYHRIKRLNK